MTAPAPTTREDIRALRLSMRRAAKARLVAQSPSYSGRYQ